MKKAILLETSFLALSLTMFYWISQAFSNKVPLPTMVTTLVLFSIHFAILDKKLKTAFLAFLFCFFSYSSDLESSYVLSGFYLVYFILDQIRSYSISQSKKDFYEKCNFSGP